MRALAKLCSSVEGEFRLVGRPPLVTPIEDVLPGAEKEHLEDTIRHMIGTYSRSLPHDRRTLLESYRYVHAARKVVGVGSVGTRAWIVLLLGRDESDPLFLQFKEAQPSVLEPFLGPSEFDQHGQRVVEGQRMMQAASDIMLGWGRVVAIDGQTKDFYIRQLWDAKASAEIEHMDTAGCGRTGGFAGGHLPGRTRVPGTGSRSPPISGRVMRSTGRWPRSPRRTRTRTSVTTGHCETRSRPASSPPRPGSEHAPRAHGQPTGRHPSRPPPAPRLRSVYVKTFTALAITSPITVSEMSDCHAIVSFAQAVIGMTSVGLNAVLVVMPEDEVVDVDRSPARRRQLGVHLLREREVGMGSLPPVAGERPAAVELPVQQPEDQGVPEPDERAGGEQRCWPTRSPALPLTRSTIRWTLATMATTASEPMSVIETGRSHRTRRARCVGLAAINTTRSAISSTGTSQRGPTALRSAAPAEARRSGR